MSQWNAMNTVQIKSPEALRVYLNDGMVYSCLTHEARNAWIDHALMAWYAPLLRDGYASVPFFAVLDLGGRILRSGAFRSANQQLDLNGLGDGVYLFRSSDGVERLVIQR